MLSGLRINKFKTRAHRVRRFLSDRGQPDGEASGADDGPMAGRFVNGLLDFPAGVCQPRGVAITARQFEALQQRVGPARRKPSPACATSFAAPGAASAQTILGIDPSLRGTGYGVIRSHRREPQLLAQGTIACPAGWGRSRCLLRIVEALRSVIREHRPTIGVVEGLFYAQNIRTALIMGEARGAALVAAAEGGLEVCEIAPRKVKQSIVGYGGAQKLAVAKMVQRMLNLATIPEPDAGDALALALAFLHESAGHRLSPPKPL